MQWPRCIAVVGVGSVQAYCCLPRECLPELPFAIQVSEWPKQLAKTAEVHLAPHPLKNAHPAMVWKPCTVSAPCRPPLSDACNLGCDLLLPTKTQSETGTLCYN